jgi:opacity protein-like surface antigen
VALATAIMAVSSTGPAVALDLSGDLYLGGYMGGSHLRNIDRRDHSFALRSDVGAGESIGGVIGFTMPSGFRAEAEIVQRRDARDPMRMSGVNGLGAVGANANALSSVTSSSGMVNSYFDLPLGFGSIVPYVGAGIGAARLSPDAAGNSFTVTEDSELALAYQGMLGVSFHFTPRAALTLGYRYFAAQEPRFRDGFGNALRSSDYRSHNIEAGFRLRF